MEHGTRDGRLNFVIPNMELQTGKRLQPYYDRADRPRIDARQTLVNHHYGLHDPNAPENRRTLTLLITCLKRNRRLLRASREV